MTLSARQHMTLTENANLFALLLNPGIDWRTACRIGSAIGQAVAASVSTHLVWAAATGTTRRGWT